jgi:hypothetical protein
VSGVYVNEKPAGAATVEKLIVGEYWDRVCTLSCKVCSMLGATIPMFGFKTIKSPVSDSPEEFADVWVKDVDVVDELEETDDELLKLVEVWEINVEEVKEEEPVVVVVEPRLKVNTTAMAAIRITITTTTIIVTEEEIPRLRPKKTLFKNYFHPPFSSGTIK